MKLSTANSFPRLMLKNETANPTWSWKDRPNSVSVAVARQMGYGKVAAKSTGNHGNSVAAYASAAGLGSTIFCHENAPLLQLALMTGYGARVVHGGNQDRLLANMLGGGDMFPCTILSAQAGYTNPYGIEGFKTIAFEICEQLNWIAPDRVYVGVGSGDVIYGIWKGFRKLAERKQIRKQPRMFACQAAGADSAYRAWRLGLLKTEALPFVITVALSVGEPITGNGALHAVYKSDGAAETCTDDEIRAAVKRLARQGIALEPASGLPFACAERALECESVNIKSANECRVVIGSGAAVKWPGDLLHNFSTPIPLRSDVEWLPE